MRRLTPERYVAAEELWPGDFVQIRAGEAFRVRRLSLLPVGSFMIAASKAMPGEIVMVERRSGIEATKADD